MKRLLTALPLLAVLLLAACGSSAQPTAAPADSGAPAPPPSLTPPPTDRVAPTLEPTPSPTPESVAELSHAELQARLNPLTAEDGCALPCYNSLVPGATVEDVMRFYARLGIGQDDLIPGDYEDARSGTGRLGAWLNKASDQAQVEAAGQRPALADVYVVDDAVQYAYIGWQAVPEGLTPADVVAALGPPAEVELGALRDETPPGYVLAMMYPAQQAAFAYYGPLDAAGQACPAAGGLERVFFGVFAPDVPMLDGLTGFDALQPASPEAVLAAVGGQGCVPLP